MRYDRTAIVVVLLYVGMLMAWGHAALTGLLFTASLPAQATIVVSTVLGGVMVVRVYRQERRRIRGGTA